MSVFQAKLTAGDALVHVLRLWGAENMHMRDLAKSFRVTEDQYVKDATTPNGNKSIKILVGADRCIWSMARSGKRQLQLKEPVKTTNYSRREELLFLHSGAFTGQVPMQIVVKDDIGTVTETLHKPSSIDAMPVYIEGQAISKAFKRILGTCRAQDVTVTHDMVMKDVAFYGETWMNQMGQPARKAKAHFAPSSKLDDGLEMIQRSYVLRAVSRACSLKGKYSRWTNTRGMPYGCEIHTTPFVATFVFKFGVQGQDYACVLGKDDLSHLIRLTFCTGLLMCIHAADPANILNKNMAEELALVNDMYFIHGKKLAWAMRQMRAEGFMRIGEDSRGADGTVQEAVAKDKDFITIASVFKEHVKMHRLDPGQSLALVDLHRVLPPQHVDPIKAAKGYVMEARDPHILASVMQGRVDECLEKMELHYLNALYKRDRVWPGSAVSFAEAKVDPTFDEDDWDKFIDIYSRNRGGLEQRWLRWIKRDGIFAKYVMPAATRSLPAFHHFAKDSAIPAPEQTKKYLEHAKLTEKNYALNLMKTGVSTDDCIAAVRAKAKFYRESSYIARHQKTEINTDIKPENHKYDEALRLFFITPRDERVTNSFCMQPLVDATEGYPPLAIGEGNSEKSDFREAIKRQVRAHKKVTRLSSDARKWSRSWLGEVISKLRARADILLFGQVSILTDMMYMFDPKLTSLVYTDNYVQMEMTAEVFDFEGMAGILLSHYAIACYDVSLEHVSRQMLSKGNRLVGQALLKIFIDDALSCSCWQPPLDEEKRDKLRHLMGDEMVKGNIWLHTKKTPVSNSYDVFTDSENIDDTPVRNPVKVIYKIGSTDISPIASFPEKVGALFSGAQAAGWQNMTTKQVAYLFSLSCKFEGMQWARTDSEAAVVGSEIFLTMMSLPHSFGGAALQQLGEIHFTGVVDKTTEIVGRYRGILRGNSMHEGPLSSKIFRLLRSVLARPLRNRSVLATFRSPSSISTVGPGFREHVASQVVRMALKRLGDKVVCLAVYDAKRHEAEEAYYISLFETRPDLLAQMRQSVQSALLILGAYRLSDLSDMDKVLSLVSKSKFVMKLMKAKEKRRVQRANMIDFVKMVGYYKGLASSLV